MGTIKVGVVGVKRGMTFIKLLQTMGDTACLHAICDNHPENAKEPLPENVKLYEDYDEFLNSGIEAVILCNFFHEHAAFAIKALEKDIHVLSETTAAPTLGDCVKLCRAAEKSKGEYMLGANVPFKRGLQLIRKEIEEGKIGDVFYGEAEYMHYSGKGKPYADDNMHWRRKMPGTFYNMHTLGPLMYVSGAVPTKVSASVIRVGNRAERMNRLIDHDGAKILCEMDNGAKFDFTACAYYGPTSKWFRLIGDKGVLETERYTEAHVVHVSSGEEFVPGESSGTINFLEPKYEELNMVPAEELATYTEEQMRLGHNGIDFWLTLYFIKYINGEHEPFFNVYRSTALSAAGILGWRSVKNGGREFEIPDFSNEEERKKYENDFYSPFAEKDSEYFVSGFANED